MVIQLFCGVQAHIFCRDRASSVTPNFTAVNNRKSPGRPLRAGEHRRTFTDEDGVFWDVREFKNSDYDRRSGSSLIFESADGFRRVRDFPADWHKLSEQALAELSRK